MNPDPRLTPARADLAALHLKGIVAAQRYAEGRAMRLAAGMAPLRRQPGDDAPMDTQLLFGEAFTVYDEKDGWAWGQAALDLYVGYVRADALAPPGPMPTHSVAVPRTFVYRDADLKSPPLFWLSMNAKLAVGERSGNFSRIQPLGWIFSAHLAKAGDHAADFVAVAENFIGTPYLWGGKDSLGMDCSGLLQTAMQRAGLACPRDSDMQANLGRSHPVNLDRLQRGDLIFWKGHVGILRDAETLLHANAFSMQVTSEPLAGAAARIENPVACIRRLAKPGG